MVASSSLAPSALFFYSTGELTQTALSHTVQKRKIYEKQAVLAKWLRRLPRKQLGSPSQVRILQTAIFFFAGKKDSLSQHWSAGAMDSASAYGAEGCRFESCADRFCSPFSFFARSSSDFFSFFLATFHSLQEVKKGLFRESNPGPLAP